MGIEQGTTLITNLLQNTNVFNVAWIFSLLATLITLIILTRDTKKWKSLALPVMIGWHISGLKPFWPLYPILGIVFVLDNLSLQDMGNLLTPITRQITAPGRAKKAVQALAKKEQTRRQKQSLKATMMLPTETGELRKQPIISDAELQAIIKGGKNKK